MSKDELKQLIEETIYDNVEGDITGSKLAGILEGIVDLIPAEQVNSDWNATEGPAEILNKPDIPFRSLVVPITIDNDHMVTLLDGAPTKAEILSALQSGRQVIGLEYIGNKVSAYMSCTAIDMEGVMPLVNFFAVNGATIEKSGVLE